VKQITDIIEEEVEIDKEDSNAEKSKLGLKMAMQLTQLMKGNLTFIVTETEQEGVWEVH
jgi:hypothetical protein